MKLSLFRKATSTISHKTPPSPFRRTSSRRPSSPLPSPFRRTSSRNSSNPTLIKTSLDWSQLDINNTAHFFDAPQTRKKASCSLSGCLPNQCSSSQVTLKDEFMVQLTDQKGSIYYKLEQNLENLNTIIETYKTFQNFGSQYEPNCCDYISKETSKDNFWNQLLTLCLLSEKTKQSKTNSSFSRRIPFRNSFSKKTSTLTKRFSPDGKTLDRKSSQYLDALDTQIKKFINSTNTPDQLNGLKKLLHSFSEQGSNPLSDLSATYTQTVPTYDLKVHEEIFPTTLSNNDTFLDYTIQKKLGEGNYGEVYLAKKADGSDVAIKLMKLSSPNDFEEIKRETIMQHYTHQLLANFYPEQTQKSPEIIDVYQDPQNKLALIMDLASGECPDALPTQHYEQFKTQLIELFTKMHLNNIFHLDLKPENTLFDSRTGSLTLLDFGNTHHLKSEQEKTAFLKKLNKIETTKAFKAPMTHQTSPLYQDSYAAAITLLYALVGKPTLEKHLDMSRDVKHLSAEPYNLKTDNPHYHLLKTATKEKDGIIKTSDYQIAWLDIINKLKMNHYHNKKELEFIQSLLLRQVSISGFAYGPISSEDTINEWIALQTPLSPRRSSIDNATEFLQSMKGFASQFIPVGPSKTPSPPSEGSAEIEIIHNLVDANNSNYDMLLKPETTQTINGVQNLHRSNTKTLISSINTFSNTLNHQLPQLDDSNTYQDNLNCINTIETQLVSQDSWNNFISITSAGKNYKTLLQALKNYYKSQISSVQNNLARARSTQAPASTTSITPAPATAPCVSTTQDDGRGALGRILSSPTVDAAPIATASAPSTSLEVAKKADFSDPSSTTQSIVQQHKAFFEQIAEQKKAKQPLRI